MSGPVKWSTGLELPRTKLPANAADCHHHIYDSRYPWAPEATLKPGDGTVADYRKLQQRIGTSRNVIVQPSSYGTDNRLLMEALGQFGGKARGVAVVTPAVTDAQLMELNKAGARGIRFNLSPPGTTTLDMVKPLATRVAKLGWHIQVFHTQLLVTPPAPPGALQSGFELSASRLGLSTPRIAFTS